MVVGRRPSLSDQRPVGEVEAEVDGRLADVPTTRHAELGEDGGDVVVHRLGRHDEPIGDLGVGQPTDE